jgi:hypothetical protein
MRQSVSQSVNQSVSQSGSQHRNADRAECRSVGDQRKLRACARAHRARNSRLRNAARSAWRAHIKGVEPRPPRGRARAVLVVVPAVVLARLVSARTRVRGRAERASERVARPVRRATLCGTRDRCARFRTPPSMASAICRFARSAHVRVRACVSACVRVSACASHLSSCMYSV